MRSPILSYFWSRDFSLKVQQVNLVFAQLIFPIWVNIVCLGTLCETDPLLITSIVESNYLERAMLFQLVLAKKQFDSYILKLLTGKRRCAKSAAKKWLKWNKPFTLTVPICLTRIDLGLFLLLKRFKSVKFKKIFLSTAFNLRFVVSKLSSTWTNCLFVKYQTI